MSRHPRHLPDGYVPPEIDEVIYGVPITKSGQVPLRWLDKPAKEYIVQHYADGTIEVRPLGERTYIVKATDDDVLYLRETQAGSDYIEVRHKANGSIWLRTKEEAARRGDIFDGKVISRVNPGRTDDFMKFYEYVQSSLDQVVITYKNQPALGYQRFPKTVKAHHVHDDWDRTHSGFNKRPRTLSDLEWRESVGEERWSEIQAKMAIEREKQRNYREKKKAKEAGKLATLPQSQKISDPPPELGSKRSALG